MWSRASAAELAQIAAEREVVGLEVRRETGKE
jgi:hypothetical protein